MKVRDVMSANPACCAPETNLQEVARMMVDHDCGQIPVVDAMDRKPVGVVTDRDIVCRTLASGVNPMDLCARDVMSSPVVTVMPETKVRDCVKVFEEQRVRRVPVVDDEGRCCGIISQADLAQNAPAKWSSEMLKTVSERVHASAQATAL